MPKMYNTKDAPQLTVHIGHKSLQARHGVLTVPDEMVPAFEAELRRSPALGAALALIDEKAAEARAKKWLDEQSKLGGGAIKGPVTSDASGSAASIRAAKDTQNSNFLKTLGEKGPEIKTGDELEPKVPVVHEIAHPSPKDGAKSLLDRFKAPTS